MTYTCGSDKPSFNVYKFYFWGNNVSLNTDPVSWTRNHVKEWLMSSVKEYNLKDLDYKKFASTDGYKLCQMTMRDFCRLTEKANAEVLLNQLSLLKQSKLTKLFVPERKLSRLNAQGSTQMNLINNLVPVARPNIFIF